MKKFLSSLVAILLTTYSFSQVVVVDNPPTNYNAVVPTSVCVGSQPCVLDGVLTSSGAATVQGLLKVEAATGAELARIGTDGKMGIGTSNPATTLSVVGNAQFGSAAAKSTMTSTGEAQHGGTGNSWFTGNLGVATTSPSTALQVGVSTLSANTLNGRVGIGLTNPTAQLELSNSTTGADFTVNLATFTIVDGLVGIGATIPGSLFPTAMLTVDTTVTDKKNNVAVIGGQTSTARRSEIYMVNSASNKYGMSLLQDGHAREALDIIGHNNSAAGTVIATFDATTNNVGIGTTGPLTMLSVGANVFNVNSTGLLGIGTTNPDNAIHVMRTGDVGITVGQATNVAWRIWHQNSDGEMYIDNQTNTADGDITFRTKTGGTPVTVMTLESAGNVGIGTTNPGTRLAVQDGIILSTTTTGFGVISAHGSSGACLMLRDTDGLAWTECKVSGGVMSCAVDADGVCD